MFRDYMDSLRKVGQNLNEVFGGAPAVRCFLNAAGLAPSGTCYSRKALLEIGGFPPMKTKRTPHDWYILFWAAFNCFEFEMIDRMVFVRMDASTAGRGQSVNQIMSDKRDMFNILLSKLNENQKRKLFSEVLRYGPYNLIKMFNKEYTMPQKIFAKLRSLYRMTIG